MPQVRVRGGGAVATEESASASVLNYTEKSVGNNH